MTSFETTNSFFNIIDEIKTLLFSTPNQWLPEGSREIVDKISDISMLKSENSIELNIREIEKRGRKMERLGHNLDNPKNKVIAIGAEIFYLNDLDTRRNEILSVLKRINYHDFEVLVY